MPLTGLEPLDSSWQPARAFVINDRRLQANRVDHRPLAGCSLHNLGSGQQVAAGARRRGGAAALGVLPGFPVVGGRLSWVFVEFLPELDVNWTSSSQVAPTQTTVGSSAPLCSGLRRFGVRALKRSQKRLIEIFRQSGVRAWYRGKVARP